MSDEESNDKKNGEIVAKNKIRDEPAYVKVFDDENDEPIEIPVEKDGLLLLSTLAAQFPGASGLKFKTEAGSMRGLRLEDGKIHAPSDDGFGDKTYIAVFPKENTKRKMDDHLDTIGATKLKRIERKKCSDLIVLGLPFKTTEEELREYFEQFGEVLVAQIKRDAKSGKSKGFGFIRFSDYDCQLKVLSQRHSIDGRMCDARIPNSKLETSNPCSHKVFVGRMTEDLDANDLRDHFSMFGSVTDVFIPKPFRSFAFVSFEDPTVAEALCGEEYVIKGCSVHVSQATPKDSAGGGGSSRSAAGAYSGNPNDRRGGSFAPPFDDSRFGRPDPFVRQQPYDLEPMRSGPPIYYSEADEYDRRSPYSKYKHPSPVNNRNSDRISPRNKISRPQAWTSSPPYSTETPPSGYGRDLLSYGRPSGYPSPWSDGSPTMQHQRSATPVQFAHAPPSVGNHATKLMANPTGPPGPHQSAAATNQATAGISALNLNSLISPAVLAAAQACLLNQLAASSGSADFSALLSNLAAANQNNSGAVPTSSGNLQQMDNGGVGGSSRAAPESNSSGTSDWQQREDKWR